MNMKKVFNFCRPFRVFLGISLIVAGVVSGIKWFYLGIIPLIAGFADFCPICIITKQCDLPEDGVQKNESN